MSKRSNKRSRRQFLRDSATGIAATGVATALPLMPIKAHAAFPKAKNVLFISIDDMNDWINALGGYPGVKTPNLDRLASLGVVFKKAYCTSPACSPSRTATLYGQSPMKTGVYTNQDEWEGSSNVKASLALPKRFKDRGFYTFGGGKIFHGNNSSEQTVGRYSFWNQFWDIEKYKKEKASRKVASQSSDQINCVYTAGSDGACQKDNENHELKYGNRGTRNDQSDWVISNWIKGKLQDRASRSKPFFAAHGIFRPHFPMVVPKEYFDRYNPAELKYPYALTRKHTGSNPYDHTNHKDLADLGRQALEFAKQNMAYHQQLENSGQYRRVVHSYLASISFADDCLGLVLDELLKNRKVKIDGKGPLVSRRLFDETLIVLWSDHGWQLGEKLAWKKSTLWERATRVPLMIAGAGVKPGVVNQPVNLLDIYPTLEEIFFGSVSSHTDGKSLVPLLENNTAPFRPASVSMWALQEGRDGRAPKLAYAVRTNNYRYIHYTNHNGKVIDRELYNTSADPNEWYNLIDKNKDINAHPQKIRQLVNIMERMIPRGSKAPHSGKA